jgi:hypothetical protein
LLTDAEWLAIFEAARDEAVARGETDFPEALSIYREAVARGNTHKAWFWISEIYSRILAKKPPATEAEYHRLVEWYRRYQVELHNDRVKVNLYFYGSRETFATETIEKLRALRAAHPELADDVPVLDFPASCGRQLLRRERMYVPGCEPRDRAPGRTRPALPGRAAGRLRNCKRFTDDDVFCVGWPGGDGPATGPAGAGMRRPGGDIDPPNSARPPRHPSSLRAGVARRAAAYLNAFRPLSRPTGGPSRHGSASSFRSSGGDPLSD